MFEMAKVLRILAVVLACVVVNCSSAAVEVISDATSTVQSTEAAVTETSKLTTSKAETTSRLETTRTETSTTEVKTTTSEPKIEMTTQLPLEETFESIEVVDSNPAEVVPVQIVPVESAFNEVPSNKRKVLYINQQQRGKLNFQLELKDVSVFILPKHKDPQNSLLNLLFKNAHKPAGNSEDKKPFNGEYSKYTPQVHAIEENDRITPNIESRTPYRVDISSTLGQTPVDLITLSPTFRHMQMMPIVQSRKLFRRSIDTRLQDMDYNTQEQPFNEITDEINFDEENLDNDDLGDFVLLGAVENCGPGRRRNSYQICVSVD